MKKLHICPMLWALIAALGCADTDRSERVTDVYLVGAEHDGRRIDDWGARYWMNGQSVALTVRGSETDENHLEALAHSIYVTDTDVYVCGYVRRGGITSKSVATVWKNGTPQYLAGEDADSVANSIAVMGDDVYVAGSERPFGQKTIAAYWRNGASVRLSDGTSDEAANAIFVRGSDVYAAGYEDTPGYKAVAKYWENGEPVTLTDGSGLDVARAISVQGDDIYVAGVIHGAAVYWKNGIAVQLTDGTRFASARSICVKDRDVYVAGSEMVRPWLSTGCGFFVCGPPPSVATYWKNGVAVRLTDGGGDAYASAILVEGNDVHVAGGEVAITSGWIVKYWKNGVATPITREGNDALVYGMLLHHH